LVVLALATLATTMTGALRGSGPVDAIYPTVVYDGAGRARHIGLIGDSTLAAVQWAGAFEPLRRYNFVFDAEPCRRTTGTSCGTPPLNALRTLRRLAGRWGRVLVMMTGYNDPGRTFASSVDAIMAEARAQRIRAVIWLTMRRAPVEYPRRDFTSTSLGFNDNNRILLQKVRPYRGRLQIADWAGRSAGKRRWVTDGIHLTSVGAAALSQFIADQVGVVLSGVSITPPAHWARLHLGSRGPRVLAAQRVLIAARIPLPGGADGIYGAYTRAAVLVYQKRHGIAVTGNVNRQTALLMGIYRLPPEPPF
jgi:hypothetical protein